MQDSEYLPHIRSHYINGIPPAELTDSPKMQELLADIFRAAEAYRQNPFINIVEYCQLKLHRCYKVAKQIKHFVEYIDVNYSTPTRKELQNKTLFLIDSVAQQALAAGDRQDQLKAASLYIKAGQLDKPEQDNAQIQILAPTELVFTQYIEEVSSGYTTIEDEELKKILREEGGIIDAMEERIDDKLELLQITSQALNKNTHERTIPQNED